MLLAETFIEGLQIYFDRGLGSILLYAFEQEQYSEMRDKYWAGQDFVIGAEKELLEIYGAEHLLRLLGEFCVMFCVALRNEDLVHYFLGYSEVARNSFRNGNGCRVNANYDRLPQQTLAVSP